MSSKKQRRQRQYKMENVLYTGTKEVTRMFATGVLYRVIYESHDETSKLQVTCNPRTLSDLVCNYSRGIRKFVG